MPCEYRAFVRDLFRAGPRKILRRHGFRQPGGGYVLSRTRGHFSTHLWFHVTFGAPPARLRFRVEQGWAGISLGLSFESPRFVIDPEHGDPRDVAVEVGEWVRAGLLPAIERDPDIRAIARALERSDSPHDLARAAELCAQLERLEAVARSRAGVEVAPGRP